MSLFPLAPTTSVTTVQPSAGSDTVLPTHQSSTLQHPKKSDILCFCVEEVDVEVFRGVFAQQWLHGHTYRSREPIYFCTSCGPPAVQEALKEGDKARKGGKGTGISSTTGKEKGKFSLSKFFSKGFTSAKKDAPLSPGIAGVGVGTSSTMSTPSTGAGSSGLASRSDSLQGGGSVGRLSSSTPAPQLSHHARGFSAEEEEAPATPRTVEELFLCTTCGACYCKSHAADHHYSRRRPDDTNWCGGGNVVNLDETNPLQGYPHHSMFIGVPSYISTHPTHLMEETPWGLLFPTIIMRELESGSLDLSKEYAYFENPDSLLDELMVHDTNAAVGGPAGKSGRTSVTHSLSASMIAKGERTPDTGLKFSASTPTKSSGFGIACGKNGASGGYHYNIGGENPRLPSQGLQYTSQGTDRWSYMCWCARCGTRPVRMSAKSYDDSNSRHRRLRQLGQSLAILSYLCRRGVMLELPARFVTWKAADDAAVRRRQQLQIQGLTAIEKRVGRATETMEFTASANAVSRGGEGPNAVTTAIGEPNSSIATGVVDLTRAETDRVLARACLSGFSNPSYLCYMNSVLQCLLRCVFFTRPLVRLPINAYPGKLSRSLGMLLHYLEQQTYQDVRNGAIYPFVKAVHQQICHISSLFELDEQQDAQELLITLLNGVADEFDKGKTAEEKKRMPRISFEGSLRSEVVCSRCHHRVPRDEMFMSLSVPIKSSLEESLRAVFTPAYLRGKDRYACERCFKKLSPKQQQEHNAQARRQAEERRQLRAEGKQVPPTCEDPAKHKAENCLYQEAEVRTSITRLGGTLAVHLLRFHYDAEQQDFVKVASPVSIPLTLNLATYVSTEVLEAYNTARSMRTLRGRFPAVAESVLQDYLRRAGGDQGLATKQLLTDGHGIEDNLESSVNGDVQLPVPTSSAVDDAAAKGDAAKPAAQRQLSMSSLLRTRENPDTKPPILGAGSSGIGSKKGDSGGGAAGIATGHRGWGGGIKGTANEASVFAAEDEDGENRSHSHNNNNNHNNGNGNENDDDDSIVSVVHSMEADATCTRSNFNSATTTNGRRGSVSNIAAAAGADSLNSMADMFGTAADSLGAVLIPVTEGGSLGQQPNTGGTRGRRSILGPANSSGTAGAATSPSATAMLTPQRILKLRTSDFDPFGDRSCPVIGGGAGERRATGGAKGLGRAPSLTRQLVGIVTHRGSLHGGHYIAYVRHLGRPEVWFRCDDEDVDIVTEKTILACAPEVYLAFYE